MFFSLLLIVIYYYDLSFWAAKLLISFELRKFKAKFFTFHFSLFTFFRTFAPKFQQIHFKKV